MGQGFCRDNGVERLTRCVMPCHRLAVSMLPKEPLNLKLRFWASEEALNLKRPFWAPKALNLKRRFWAPKRRPYSS